MMGGHRPGALGAVCFGVRPVPQALLPGPSMAVEKGFT